MFKSIKCHALLFIVSLGMSLPLSLTSLFYGVLFKREDRLKAAQLEDSKAKKDREYSFNWSNGITFMLKHFVVIGFFFAVTVSLLKILSLFQ